MTSSLGIAPLLKPVEKLNKKWLDRDPKDVLSKDVLFKWYNELLSEKEIYIRPDSFLNRDGFASHKSSNGHYYCGQSTLNCSCCNTICGPSHGCNCKSCQEIEETLKENKDLHTSEVFLLKEYVEAWAWGKLPTQKELKNFTKLVAQQQLLLFKKSTESIKFMQNLKPKMFVYARFLSVYSRTCFLPSTMKDAKKAPTEEKSQNKPLIVTNLPKEINTEEEFAHSSLILVFKTAFKYIDSKCGIFEEDIFCTEILNETLNMLQSIAKPLIYDGDEKKSSKLLLGFLKHSADYLYNIISRPIYSLNLSLRYNQTFIELLLEIAFQTTSLTSLLKVANLYMFRKEEGCLLYSYQLEKFLKKLIEQSFQMQFEYAIVSKYFSNCPISGILSDTLSLYESLDKEEDPDQPDKDKSPDQPDKDKMSPDELRSYVRIQSMLETLSKNLPDEDESPDEDASPDEPEKDEENEGKDMYKFVQKLLKALTLTARPLEEYKTEEEKKVATTKQGDELVWGNLKLLSSLKEEKPNVKIANICCTDTLVFILSLNGTVYCCEHDKDKLELKVYPQLKGLKIMQLTCSFDGHFIALTNTGHIITWKDVNSVFEHMTSVPLQIKGKVITVAAGFGFYSITTDQNEVCIWGNTFSGSANYEQHKDGFTPRQFCEFENTKIIDLAFSQYQQEVIFVTEEGKIWSWKNGTTMSLISANYPNVVNVYVAKYFYVALASNGQVYRWGRDRFSKTPHDSEVQLQPVVKLNKESIASISVGAYHCIAITNTSNVYCWGGLGGKEEEEMIIREPVLLKAVSELGVSRIVAGPHQIFCWRVSFVNPLKKHVPFAIEINRETFENLEQLLSYSQKVEDPEVKDDLISSCLYLLKMQFHGARAHDVCTCFLGFDGTSEFSQKLKSLVINLISTLPYHSKIHKLAEEVLSVGWLYLLPSAIERATTFSTLLKIKTETNSENHSFLLQLLMKCFLEKNGLEEMLEDTLDLLIANSNNDDFDPTNSTLFILLKELFYVTTSCILVSVKEEDPRLIEQESLNVLLKFQRLMFARVFIVTEKDICWPARCYVYEPTPMVKSLTAVISTFINLLQTSCKQLLVYHSMVRKCSHKRLQESPIGIIFQEFSIYLILLQNYAPIITSNCETFAQFAEILDWFDKLNRSFSENDPEKEKLAEKAELSWPVSTASSVNNVQYDTKKKVENSKDKNEEKDDGAEIECSEKAQEDSLSSFVDKEVSTAIADVLNFTNIKILNKDKTATQPKMMLMSANTKEEGLGQHFVEAEQSIAFVLGLHCCYLAHGTYASHDETENKRFLHSTLFSSGINRDAVLKEKKEKNEEDASSDSDVLSLLSEEPCASTGVVMKNVFKMATDEGLLIIPPRGDPTSVIEQTTRCIFACLLWHCGLGTNLKGLQDDLDEKCLSKYKTKDFMLIITRLVAMRSKVFQLHQEEEKPLEEICQPIIKKCQFLCKCVNASQSPSKSHVKRRWIETCERLQKTQDPPYKWRVFLWKGLKNLQQAEQKRTSALNVLIDELKDFLFDKKVNTDILRKCFLMQIKRAKQRLIAGYLMQSLCLRQQIFSHVRYSLLCGWLGLLVPGGSVSHAKPGILFNVELVPKDDVDKLRSVFHGFENFALKALIDEIEKLSDFQTEDEINGHVREMLLSLTLLCSSLMSDDVNFMVLCGVLDKIQKLLKKIMKLTLNNDEKSDIPFIDERKHRQVHLQELDGEEMRKLLKIGSRVVRGPDWKWDDQDGPTPSQGRVVSDIGDDGWVRVEWDTGSRNSYRMGKNGKYDLKLADNIQFFDEDDKDDHVHEKDINKDNQNEDNQLKSPLSFLLKSMTSYIVNTLSLCACNGEKTSSNALSTVASFFIESLRNIIDTSVSSWGADISVSAYFGFCRALSCSQQIEKIIGVRDWVTLLINMFDLSFLMHDPSNGGNSFLVKIQLLKHIKFLLKLQSNNAPFPSKWKRQIVGSMMKALHRMLKQDAIFMTESYDLHAAKSSMAASALTTIAEEIFSLLRYLHELQEWRDMINFQIWRYLKSLDESTFSVELQTRVFTSLCIIGGIDPRIRVGGLVHHEKHGNGTCVDILPNGKILLYFGNSIKPKTCHLSKLDVKAQSSLNLLTLADYQKHQNLFSCLLSIALKGVTIDWDKQPGGSMIVSKTRLYMSVLACLRILFKEPDLFIKTISREPANRLMLKELVEKALVSSPIQTTYEELELEISGLALSEKMLLDSSSNENNIFAKHDTKTTFSQKTTTKSSKKLSSEMIASMPSLSHVLEMGFTVESVEHALNELGEDTRAERLVSWLLQHPEVQKKGAVASEGSAESEQPRDVSLFHPHEAGLSKFPIGCLVKTIFKAGDVDEYGLGTVVKVIGADENILVYWETQNKALWTTADKIQIVDDFMKPKTQDVIKEGSYVRIKQIGTSHKLNMTPLLLNRVGTVTYLHHNGLDCSVTFEEMPLWHGTIRDLELVGPVHSRVTCDGCERKPVVGVRYKCKTCDDFDFCEHCFANKTDHDHNFVAYHRSKKGQHPIEAGKPGRARTEWCHSSSEKHLCIKEMTVSSNEHMAAKMINKEIDMPWISEKAFGAHKIDLTINPHVLITNMSVVLDVDQNETYPSRFTIFAGASKNQTKLIKDVYVKGNQSTVQLLHCQEELYSFVEIQIFVGDGSTESSCKICHLSLTGQRRRKDYDQLIMKMICSVQKKSEIKDHFLQIKQQYDGFTKQKNANKQIKIFGWGLNDKDQLGGLKGSKIKSPVLCSKMSSLHCKEVVGGSKTMFCISNKGHVYACGHSAGGRLGLGPTSDNVASPQLIEALKGHVIKKIAVHARGVHCLALTDQGEVFSWGDNEFGKLGHGDTTSLDTPKLVEALRGLNVTHLACGSNHSAVIVDHKELYTWGSGEFGRLGHGDEETHFLPKLIKSLLPYNIIDVSCGSTDAQTLALSSDGNIWSWGDGDFGKLGRGGSEGCLSPTLITKLSNQNVCKVLCGAQFSLALTKNGEVWTWGKGDFYRLGHGCDQHYREPKLVEGLIGKKIVDIAVGVLHCLAVSENGEVYAWGDNDHGQQGVGTTMVCKTPTRLLATDGYRIQRVACGSSHSFAWCETNNACDILDDFHIFSPALDPLGTSVVLQKHPFRSPSLQNIAKMMKDQRPSLVRTVLQLHSKDLQKEALNKILQAAEILFCRQTLTQFLKNIKQIPEATSRSLLNEVFGVECLVNLLKLAINGHSSSDTDTFIEDYLKEMCYKNIKVSQCLLNTCIAELEEKIAYNLTLQEKYKPCVQESSHPYQGVPGVKLSGSVKFPGAAMLLVEFNDQCQTEAAHDVLTFFDQAGRTLAVRTGHLPTDWNTKLKVTGEELNWSFTTNSPGGLWGFKFVVTPVPPVDDSESSTWSDTSILQTPCMELVKRLLRIAIPNGCFNELTILKLASLLATCIRIKLIAYEEKRWMLNQLHLLLLSPNAPPVNVPLIFNSSATHDPSACKLRISGNQAIQDAVTSSTLAEFISGIPNALLKQYEYEEGHVRSGDQLMHSTFLRSLALFACSLGIDTLPVCHDKYKWAWFHKYCTAIRAAQSFIQNSQLPKSFSQTVRGRLEEIKGENESTLSLDYENNDLFDRTQDEQILTWLNRRSQDWSVIWGGSGTIYGWGHNHRGQLGGIDGTRIKRPAVCDSLAALKPTQIVGGEQSLFCVTGDGKVYATGYGNSSRLGLGIIESVNTPRLIESLQHIMIKKVSVHSGGRHCLALSSDGEIFSWGEGDDGKLGHGNRVSCGHPKLIDSFRGKLMTDISAGGSHSAALSDTGELYTWGKGRYGRLGHGDGEDQLRPKMVEALKDYCVVDIACGSGDAQTLCITNNDQVWSWGDGDYGKLGRGGSDGCKVPLLIEELSGKSVIHVECGSQFSMALTRNGALYTWGKGDYYRLGHGSEDHVRRPKRVSALELKIVTSICCGSLHCVATTSDGEIYCWGDNDEGQLGDNTTNAGHEPKLCTALQSKKIDQIACGSAHTIAWSTCENGERTIPNNIPIEYNYLHELSMTTIRNRALLLHSFSKVFCSSIPLMDLIEDNDVSCGGELMINSLKGIILSSYKENFFRKIIDLTMVRDRQHGPVVELNRVKKHRSTRDADEDCSKSVFAQLTSKISEFSLESFCLPHRIWKVKFIGESVDDCGGGFSESIAELCDELQNGTLPLLVATPNSKEEGSTQSDYFIINPFAKDKEHKEMFRFLGIVFGVAIRCGSPLNLRLAESVWKLLVGHTLNLDDLQDLDRGFVSKQSYLTSLQNDNLPSPETTPDEIDEVAALDLSFTVRSASGEDVPLSQTPCIITRENKQDYLKKALKYRLNEFNEQIRWIRAGLSQVVPVPLLSLFTGPELENMVCGSPEISVESLKSITSYRGVESTSHLVQWFWQSLEEFTNHERSLFLRFVWGRTRLPRTAMDFKGKDFIFQVLEKYQPPDTYLPESYTCFFLLKMPKYTTFEILREKLKYAIYFCKSIDSDDYARIDLMHR